MDLPVGGGADCHIGDAGRGARASATTSDRSQRLYNLGSIAGHNVVIAGLHQPGKIPTATVVTQMRRTFPIPRFGMLVGMLVGIGGGVPVKTNNGMIRLGDVVVSKPTGRCSGAVQYDHGKAKVGQYIQDDYCASSLLMSLET